MKLRTKVLSVAGLSIAGVALCAVFAHTNGPGAEGARMMLLPTFIAEVLIDGVHGSGGIFSQVIALFISVLVYGLLFWAAISVVTRKKPNQPPESAAPGSRGSS